MLRESCDLYPHFKTLELLGECLLESGFATKAIVPLAAASFLNKGVKAKSLLAKSLLASGMRRDALDIANKVLEESPNNKIAKDVISSQDSSGEGEPGHP